MTCRIGSLSAAALSSACVAGVMFAATAARAYDAEYVFGDSLSDNGNLAEFENTPYLDPPSYHFSYTNGPVAVAVLAQTLGLPALEPSLWLNNFSDEHGIFNPPITPGTNYAVAGATANAAGYGGGEVINLPQQVDAYTTHVGNVADPSALYVIMIGGNDVINAVTDPAQTGPAAAYILGGVASEISEITTLATDGARNFLIVNVPNVGIIPLLAGTAGATPATQLSQLYDATLQTQLDDLALPTGAALNEFNLYAYNAALLANAGEYGFTNITDPCYSNAPASDASDYGCSLSNIDSFIYWNNVHPTGAVQALWGEGMAQTIPEPSTWAMLLAGFAGTGLMGLSARKRRSA